MPKLIDPDVDTIILKGCGQPEASIREIVEMYYQEYFDPVESRALARDLINAHNELSKKPP